MADIRVTKKDECSLKVHCEPGIAQQLSSYFEFDVPNAKWHPLYKARQWDGKKRLFHLLSQELPIGLLDYLKQYASDNGYTIDISEYAGAGEEVSYEDVVAFCKALRLTAHGKEIEIRDYQIDAIYRSINAGRRLLLSPTGSGKSLIIYCLMRWHLLKNRRQLIIVPTTSLVEQLKTDFADYSTLNKWSTKGIATIYGGSEKTNSAEIVISTWQSVYKMPKPFFSAFQCIYGDEAHLFKAKSLTTIFDKCTTTPYRIGTTGTLDGTETHRLVLEGMFGPVLKVTTTRELIDAEQLAGVKIFCLQLIYSDEERKHISRKEATYREEIDYIVSHTKRNRFIRNLALDQKGNTLLLFQYVDKHGRLLYNMIQEKAHDTRKIFFVYGATETEAREDIRRITEKETDAIIVASVGTFSTGINIRNLHNVIFASPTKSRIRNLQSIGRGLRRTDTKDKCKVFDISDDFSWKTRKNYTLLHMIERVKIYAGEKLDYSIVRIPL